MKQVISVLLCIFILTPTLLSAQETKDEEIEPRRQPSDFELGKRPAVREEEPESFDEIFGRYLETNGGRAAIDRVLSLRMIGNLIFNEQEIRFQMIKKRPNRMQLTQYLPDFEWVTVTDGEEAWEYIIREGVKSTPKLLDEVRRNQFIDSAIFDSVFMRNARVSGAVTLLGKETFNNIPCWVMTMREGDNEYRVYIDERTYREVGVVRTDTQDLTEKTLFSRYQKIEPLWIPFVIQQAGRGPERSIELEEVRLNVGVFDSFFDNPVE